MLLQTCVPQGTTWPIARALGVGLWVRNPLTLKAVVEKMAQSQFSLNKDPHDCTLFYLALDKKAHLVALFKAVR